VRQSPQKRRKDSIEPSHIDYSTFSPTTASVKQMLQTMTSPKEVKEWTKQAKQLLQSNPSLNKKFKKLEQLENRRKPDFFETQINFKSQLAKPSPKKSLIMTNGKIKGYLGEGGHFISSP
jgi:hypothetical protein